MMKRLTISRPNWNLDMLVFEGRRDGAVVRTLASHRFHGLGAICGLNLLLVLVLAPRGFSLGTPVFPSPQKINVL